MKPCSDLAPDPEALQALHALVRERLRESGIVLKVPKKRVFPVTPMRQPSYGKKVFGRPIRDLAPNTVLVGDSEATVPHFLSSVVDYLRLHKGTEGLFRKAGSASRQKSLRTEVEAADTFYPDDEACPGHVALDAASLLKQWLRELPEPLIPYKLHEALLQCSTSLSEPEKTETILLCCLLLPPLNASSLAYLVRFLSEVSESKDSNKMDARSLAIVFTPCLFSVEEEASFSKNAENRNNSLGAKLEVVRILISNASRVCMLDEATETALNLQADFASRSGDNLEDGTEAQGGPSARGREKKKRRSGSLSRVLSATMKGIHRAISRSTTPSGARSQQADCSSSLRTPFDFSSPSIVPSAKRRATERRGSPEKKCAFEASLTPKVVRHGSITIKNRFKRKKSLLGAKSAKENGIPIISGPSTPLPNKPTLASLNLLSATTPNTPHIFDTYLPSVGQDLSVGNLELSRLKDDKCDIKSIHNISKATPGHDMSLSSLMLEEKDLKTSMTDPNGSIFDYRTPAIPITTSSSSASSSQTSLSSNGSGKRRRSAERRKPRSPSERKIGIVRRRSQEMARKANNSGPRVQHKPNVATFDFPDEASLKSHLRRGNLTSTIKVKPSPMKAEPAERIVTRVRIGSSEDSQQKRFLNESLTNLRHDISSLIESSFGCSGNESKKNESAVANDNTGGIQLQKMTISGTPLKGNFAVPMVGGSLNSVNRSGIMRRQSSAFEFSRPETESTKSLPTWPGLGGSTQSVRRQSSAFEIGALANRKEPIYENFERVTTRASLRQRNSSVKDLVQRLESSVARKSDSNLNEDKRRSISTSSLLLKPSTSTMFPPLEVPPPPPPTKTASNPPTTKVIPNPVPTLRSASTPPQKKETKMAAPTFDPFDSGNSDQFDEQWMDASEFFNAKNPSVFVMNDDAPSGCKRSSIIRMRKEKKGIVSKTVETFTRPAVPTTTTTTHQFTPSRQPMGRPAMITPNNQRRTSARMGVATSVRSANPAGPGFVTPNPASSSGVAARRQTLTGIRTTPQHSNRRTPAPAQPVVLKDPPKIMVEASKPSEPIYANVDVLKTPSCDKKVKKDTPIRNVAGKLRPHSDRRLDRPNVAKRHEIADDKSLRKSKRLEGRRHLTIGYEGEVRSPLRERQNVLSATVQRSQSAQTPKPKPTARKGLKSENDDDTDEIFELKEVSRSQSLRTQTGITVPTSLRETIYDVTTPKSEKVRRNLSDRIMTPSRGQQAAVPFIKTALNQSRTKGTPIRQRLPGPSPYSKRSPRKLLNRY